MFDKIKFAKILNDINDSYDTMTEFAQKSGVNRTYISQYINQKLDAPPSPKVLTKIANHSNKITNYEELMLVCGYLKKNMEFTEISKNIFNKYYPLIQELNLDDTLIDVMYKMSMDSQKYEDQFNTMVSKLPQKTQNRIYEVSSKIIFEINEMMADTINNISIRTKYKIDDNILIQYYKCPVYGKISAGQPNWAEECIEGYLPIDPNLMNITEPEETFFLRVDGESMNEVVKNGGYALIRKQDYAEDGDIVVAIVNGNNEATLKRFKKFNEQFVSFEPMSSDESIKPINVDLKETNVIILGKYIGKFEMN